MDHRVAIWANGPQVTNWVHNIGSLYFRERNNMVYMDKILTNVSVAICEIDSAHRAVVAVMS